MLLVIRFVSTASPRRTFGHSGLATHICGKPFHMLRSPHSLLHLASLVSVARLRSAALVPIRHPQLGRPPPPLKLICFSPPHLTFTATPPGVQARLPCRRFPLATLSLAHPLLRIVLFSSRGNQLLGKRMPGHGGGVMFSRTPCGTHAAPRLLVICNGQRLPSAALRVREPSLPHRWQPISCLKNLSPLACTLPTQR